MLTTCLILCINRPRSGIYHLPFTIHCLPIMAMLLAATATGAELRVHSQCTVNSAVVRLGDVAEVVGADQRQADKLAEIELFPAPGATQQRFLRVREIQDLLLLRGINLTEHRFSGASQVTVQGAAPVARPESPLTVLAARKSNRRMSDAVAEYLRQHAEANEPWSVEAELSEAQARAVADPARAISISGGREPWTGRQRFEATVESPQGPVRFTFDAQVSLPVAVVVATRSLPRGTVIRATDVEVQRQGPGEATATAFHSVEEVVDREIVRAVSAGKAISQELLRSPIMVRRGEVVTVSSRNGGVRVRTTGRARDEGGVGDLVAIESLYDRSTYFARVSGAREVEVYGRAARVEQAEAATESRTIRR